MGDGDKRIWTIVPIPGVEGRETTLPGTQPVPQPHSDCLCWFTEVNELVSSIKCHFFLKLLLLLHIPKENALAELF